MYLMPPARCRAKMSLDRVQDSRRLAHPASGVHIQRPVPAASLRKLSPDINAHPGCGGGAAHACARRAGSGGRVPGLGGSAASGWVRVSPCRLGSGRVGAPCGSARVRAHTLGVAEALRMRVRAVRGLGDVCRALGAQRRDSGVRRGLRSD